MTVAANSNKPLSSDATGAVVKVVMLGSPN
jgi:hypothetical protein